MASEISRRNFLLGTTGAIIAPGLQKFFPPAKSTHADVIVIGAGASGLYCGFYLNLIYKGSISVLTLEGRDRIGGRVQTENVAGIPLDLGANHIRWGTFTGNGLYFTKSLPKLRAVTQDFGPLFSESGKVIPVTDSTFDGFTRISSQLKFLSDLKSTDMALEKHLMEQFPGAMNDPLLQYIFNGYLGTHVGPLSDLSAKDWNTYEHQVGRYTVITDGMINLFNHIIPGQDIQLNTIVRAIRQDQHGVTIETNRGNFSAKWVICTVPLGVLKAGSVSFDPGLSQEKLDAINTIGVGYRNKIHLKFPKVFWPKSSGFGFCTGAPETFFIVENTQLHHGHGVLCAHASGNFAQQIEELSQEQVTNLIMNQLRDAFGEGIPDPEWVKTSKWSNDPFSLGAFSFPGVGTTEATWEALARPEGRIFFAGEHCFPPYRGTIKGAVISARFAYSEILKLVRPKK